MKQDIENIIKKNLPETRYELGGYPEEGYYIEVSEDGEYIKSDEINTSLIADEVLKVEIEAIEKLFEPIEDWIGEQVIEYRKQYNSGLQKVINLLSEHLSTNKENKK